MPDTPDSYYVHLKDYMEMKLAEMDRRIIGSIADRDARIQIALTAAKEAVDKAEAANERRLGLLNEFRAQQADEASKYAPSALVRQQFDAMGDRLNRNENGLTAMLAATGSFADVEKRLGRVENTVAGLQGKAAILGGIIALTAGTIAALIVKAVGG